MEKIEFTEGFEYKQFIFGWRGKRLFRLPATINGRYYGIKKLNKIKIKSSGDKNITGFRVARDKKSLNQLKSMTKNIYVTVSKDSCKEC